MFDEIRKRRQPKTLRGFSLEYFWTCGLDERPGKRLRNVCVDLTPEYLKPPTLSPPSLWAFKFAHVLEGRDPFCTEGIWGISLWRSYRMVGMLQTPLPETNDSFQMLTEEDLKCAKSFRVLCYSRLVDSASAIRMLNAYQPVNYACEITEDWYDPDDGRIPKLGPDDKFVGSHAFAVHGYSPSYESFAFANSWGSEWGNGGYGFLPASNWEPSLISAWDSTTHGAYINHQSHGVVIRGWKFAHPVGNSVHAIEIFDADEDEYLAWAFSVRRGNYLDVDEFFVRPEERGKGLARILADQVRLLARRMKLPIRLIISFADTEESSIGGTAAVARLFEVQLVESDVRWASKFGIAGAVSAVPRKWNPKRPASMLEWLRPRSATPLSDPRQYTVLYGTDRQPVDENDLSRGFSSKRGNRLVRGSCLIEIPMTHKFGSVGRSWVAMLPSAKSEQFQLVCINPMQQGEFESFAQALSTSQGGKNNLLFLHGYRNSFEDAALQAAQLGFDLKINGSTFFYSWASKGSIGGYGADESTVEVSAKYCVEFIIELLCAFPDTPLNVIAHSMGSRLAVLLFEELGRLKKIPGKLGHLIFAAADIDIDRFDQATERIASIPKRITSYVSRGDGAIQLSELIHSSPRLGLAPPLTVRPGVDTILAEGFSIFDFEGHGYFAQAAPILSDIFDLIRNDSPPDDRPRTIEERDEATERKYWSLQIS